MDRIEGQKYKIVKKLQDLTQSCLPNDPGEPEEEHNAPNVEQTSHLE